MAVTLEELQIKFKSEIAAATSKDEAALARVDAAVRQSAVGLDKLRAAHAKTAEAARASEREQAIADSQLRNAKPEEQAKRLAAARAANSRAAKAAAAEEASASKLGEAHKGHRALVAAKPDLVALAKASAEAKSQAAETAGALAKVGQGVSAAGGPLGGLLGKMELFKDIGFAGAVGLAAGAVVVLTAAALAGVSALASYGLAAAGAARDARILADALTGSATLGAEFDAVVTQLASKVPMARGQIADLARELNLMKLGRRDMQAGLTAIAITTSAIGDAAGNVIKGVVQSSAAMKRFTLGARNMWGEYQGLAGSGLTSNEVLTALAAQLGVGIQEAEKRLRTGRVSIKDGMRALEAATESRFGGAIAAKMKAFDVQLSKAKENLDGMFRDVDIEPALDGLKSLLSIFDDSTVAGTMLKTLLNEGLGGISRALGVILPLGKDFFLEMMIGALEMYLAVRPIARQIRDWIEPFLTAKNAATAGKVAIYGLAAAFGLVAIAAGAAVALLVTPFVLAGLAIWSLVTTVSDAWDWLVNDAAAAGANLIDSFVGMLTSGVDRAMNAAKDLANSVAGAFKSALGIASPSKVFAAYGRYTVQGLVQGVEQEAPQAQGAVDDMAPTPPGGGGTGAVARFGAGTTVNVYVGDIYFAGQKATEQETLGIVEVLKQQLQAGINAVGAGEPLGAQV